MVVIELHRQSRSDELLSYLIQLQASDPLVQLHAAQVCLRLSKPVQALIPLLFLVDFTRLYSAFLRPDPSMNLY